MKASRIMMAVVVVAAGTSAACTRAVVYKESSPKPVVVHDQDPGGGQESGDVVLVYDKHLDVYVVSGYTDCYYTAGQYFRWVDGSWQWSVNISTGWRIVADNREVPTSLCAKHGRGNGYAGDKNN